ncbi:MAG: hypothetical protein AB1705_15435 [Verrucomicrobiota bacterium]
MIGPGKYDAEAQRLFEETRAESVLIVVVGGKKGNGISAKNTGIVAGKRLADLLRGVAEGLERDALLAMAAAATEAAGAVKTYELVNDGAAIKCLRCGMTSYHPQDVAHKYCGNCHVFHHLAVGPKEYS